MKQDAGFLYDVYESDILEVDGELFVVEWSDSNRAWMGRSLSDNESVPLFDLEHAVLQGNIYENPELIKEQ